VITLQCNDTFLEPCVINKQGGTIDRAKLTHVAYLSGMEFDVCSLSKLCQDGWEMKGNKEMLLHAGEG
jgi:hypothetical protein